MGRGKTADATSHSRDRIRPSFCNKHVPQLKEGAGNAGATIAPAALCANEKSTQAKSPQVRRNNPTFPARRFYGFLRALPGDRALLPPSFADRSTTLAPASGRQDHTTSPSASASFVFEALASIASRTQRS